MTLLNLRSNVAMGTSSRLMEHSHGKDMNYITSKAIEVIAYVKAHNLEIRFSGEDSFRSDFDDLLLLYTTVDQIGVNRVGIADTVGCASPIQVYDLVRALRKAISCDIEVHFHNDTGCAIANSYCALEAGATHIDTSVLGIGERNGITPLGDLMARMTAADRDYVVGKYRLEELSNLEGLVARAVEVEVPFNNCRPVLERIYPSSLASYSLCTKPANLRTSLEMRQAEIPSRLYRDLPFAKHHSKLARCRPDHLQYQIEYPYPYYRQPYKSGSDPARTDSEQHASSPGSAFPAKVVSPLASVPTPH